MTTQPKSYPCLHCKAPAPVENGFCCLGCKTVYKLLHHHQLDQFYSLREATFDGQAPAVNPAGQAFSYLDQDSILAAHASTDGLDMDFYVEGIHCHACVWLIEKLPALVPGLETATVNMQDQTLRLSRQPQGRFSEAAQTLDKLGYRLHLQDAGGKHKVQKANAKASLLRIGVAAACMANIMIFSISIYAGLQGQLKEVFDWLSALLMLPVIGYCSQPFFRSAWSALRLRVMSIDIPIALALIVGTSMSVFNLVKGTGSLYFDSLAMFVFLVLSVRHLFVASYQQLDMQSTLTATLLPLESTKILPETTQVLPTSSLLPEDLVLVKTGETIPVDGTLKTLGYIDVQLLTGESYPVRKAPGESVLAGMKNAGPDCQVQVEKIGAETRLGALIHHINNLEKPRLVQVADKVAHWFLLLTISLAVGLFLYHALLQNSLQTGLDSALALIVLACPCALSLATPLAYAISINQAAKAGICIQSPSALDRLTRIKTLFFDKTGTLTKGQLEVTSLQVHQHDLPVYNLLFALETPSKHPIAAAIRRYLIDQKLLSETPAIDDWHEVVGKGVFGVYQGQAVAVQSVEKQTDGIVSSVGLYVDGQCVADMELADTLVDNAKPIVMALKKMGFDMAILSGDQAPCVASIGQQLGIANAQSKLSPETKADILANTQNAAMIGDGANDTQAMLNASVAIAVQGSFESSLKVSDVYLVSHHLSQLPSLFTLARHTKTVIWTNFAMSLTYNLLGISLVIMGVVHPLVAAVLMPISSLSVILHSWQRLGRRPIWKS